MIDAIAGEEKLEFASAGFNGGWEKRLKIQVRDSVRSAFRTEDRKSVV